MNVTLLERQPGVFRLRIETKDANGKRHHKYETVRGQVQALARARQLRARPADAPTTQPETVGRFVQVWLAERETYGEIRRTTAATYRHTLQPVIDLVGNRRLLDFSADDLTDVFRTLAQQIGAQRTAAIATLLRKAFRDAHIRGLVAVDPGVDARAPVIRKKTKSTTLTAAQMTALAEQSHDWGDTGAIIRLALGTGLRRAEICGLQWQDIDLDAGVLFVRRIITTTVGERHVTEPKTMKSLRSVKLPQALVTELLARKADARPTDWVFTDRYGDCCNPSVVSMAVKAKLGRFTLHDLRHAHATYLLQQRLPLKAVSERLGHADVRVTLSVYAHVLPGDDDVLAGAINAVL